jgi:hypothetical protein
MELLYDLGEGDAAHRRQPMALTARLMNPTPWDVELPYEKGVVITVPRFGSQDLTMQQMDDFRDGKPGSENVQEVLNYFGLFLFDPDRPYNNQALHALEVSHKAKKERIRSIRDGLEARSVNLPGGGADIDEQFKRLGFKTLEIEVEVLEKQINKYKSSTVDESVIVQNLDPERTIFVMDPPTEFPSREAMEFFLSLPENEAVRVRHEEFLAQQGETTETQEE